MEGFSCCLNRPPEWSPVHGRNGKAFVLASNLLGGDVDNDIES